MTVLITCCDFHWLYQKLILYTCSCVVGLQLHCVSGGGGGESGSFTCSQSCCVGMNVDAHSLCLSGKESQ